MVTSLVEKTKDNSIIFISLNIIVIFIAFRFQKILEARITSRSQLEIPSCVAVFSSSGDAKHTHRYLHAYHRSYLHLDSLQPHPARLFTMDLKEPSNSAG